MTFYQLTDEQLRTFDKLPEVAMATQVAQDKSGELLVIASGRLAIKFDESIQTDLMVYREYFLLDGLTETFDIGARTEAWADNLPKAPALTPLDTRAGWTALAFIHLGPRFPLPPTPYRPSYIHGHLPFHGTCGGVEKYYRYEQFPSSRRINRKTSSVVANDTYGAPASEAPFTPTGLSAVGRFALPLLIPACWRYELTPAPKTPMYYGASVPLYGQSGGAVEVMFPNPFKNVGTIPPAHVLPIL